MKKIITLALVSALALTASITAFATDITPDTPAPKEADTNVIFDVAPNYTITIPSEITLEQKTENGVTTYEKVLEITADSVKLPKTKQIAVTMTGDFKFTADDTDQSTVDYTVTVGNSTAAIANGDRVATFSTNTAQQSSKLNFKANEPEYAGKYEDTVTFNIAIENA